MLRPTRDHVTLVVTLIAAAVLAVVVRPARTYTFGYDPDPAGAQQFASSLDRPTYAEAAPDAMAKTKRVDTYLWRAMDVAHRQRYGVAFKPSNQRNIGSCVAHATCHCIYASEAISYSLGERSEPPLLPHQGAVYGGSRVEARGKDGSGRSPVGGYSDGSTGYHAAKWCRDWGVVYKKAYPSRDCTTSNPDIEGEMGAYGCGGKGDDGRLDAVAKEHPCLHIAQCKTWDELVTAILNGHPVLLCSSQGFSRTLSADSTASPQGRWLHAMAGVGVRFSPREQCAIMNSWGNYITYTAPRQPADLPDGTFWADRQVVERMLASGDCWVISEVAFEYRPINHDAWIDRDE